ncbi:MAG: hypothetical protein ACRDVG_15585, partial [Jatrophihabitantaceae bacterium]
VTTRSATAPPVHPSAPATPHSSRTHTAPPPRVRPSRPLRLSIPAIGLRAGYDDGSRFGAVRSARVDGQWTITPPEATWSDLQSVYWWSERAYSALPGEPSAGTTFVYMHACSHVVCAGNQLHLLSPGETITMTTATGTLTYTVQRTVLLDKSPRGVGASKLVYSYGRVGALRLVTCGYAPDGTSPYNWAVLAVLRAGRPSAASNR